MPFPLLVILFYTFILAAAFWAILTIRNNYVVLFPLVTVFTMCYFITHLTGLYDTGNCEKLKAGE